MINIGTCAYYKILNSHLTCISYNPIDIELNWKNRIHLQWTAKAGSLAVGSYQNNTTNLTTVIKSTDISAHLTQNKCQGATSNTYKCRRRITPTRIRWKKLQTKKDL